MTEDKLNPSEIINLYEELVAKAEILTDDHEYIMRKDAQMDRVDSISHIHNCSGEIIMTIFGINYSTRDYDDSEVQLDIPESVFSLPVEDVRKWMDSELEKILAADRLIEDQKKREKLEQEEINKKNKVIAEKKLLSELIEKYGDVVV